MKNFIMIAGICASFALVSFTGATTAEVAVAPTSIENVGNVEMMAVAPIVHGSHTSQDLRRCPNLTFLRQCAPGRIIRGHCKRRGRVFHANKRCTV